MADARNPFVAMLADAQIQDILALSQKTKSGDIHQKLVALRGSDSIDLAIATLAENRVLSAPVFSENLKNFDGMLDIKDILDFIVKALQHQNATSKEAIASTRISGTVADIIANSSGAFSAFLPLKPTDPAVKLLEVFAQSTFHRVVLFNPSDPLNSVLVSQSDMVRFLWSKYSSSGPSPLRDLGNSPIDSLGLVDYSAAEKAEIYGIKSGDRMMDCLSLLRVCGPLTALPVLAGAAGSSGPRGYLCTSDDEVIGTFSASNLRGFTLDQLAFLSGTVADFLQVTGQNTGVISLDTQSPSDNTLAHLLRSFVDNRVHRIWLLKNGKHPAGVLSLGDVLRWLHSSSSPL